MSSSQPNPASSGPLQMSWRPQYRSSKFRNVYGKVANREHCFDGIPITKNVHDNHFCAVNARFLAIVTESAGGGSFLVIPLEQVSGPRCPEILTENLDLGCLRSVFSASRWVPVWRTGSHLSLGTAWALPFYLSVHLV